MKKRVLLVTNGFPFGESERSFLSEEVKLLTEKFDLFVLAPENNDLLLYPVRGIIGIERYRFSSFRQTRNLRAIPHVLQMSVLREAWDFAKAKAFSDPISKLRRTLYYRFNVWEMEQQIGSLVQSKKIDIIYTYWCNECTVAAVKLKKRFPHLKVVTRFHGMDLYEERTPENWQFFRKEIACRADGLCFACEYGRSYFQERWGIQYAKKMHLCYLGSIDRGALELHREDTPILRIISCSNLIPLKRVDLIIEGLALLPDSLQVEWNHFGDGTERGKLEQLAAERFRGRSNIRWRFHGFVPNAALAEEYRKIAPHLFVTTSSTEGGAPVSIQEAFSMGIPAIGTPIGGIPDLIIEGKTGYLLPQNVKPAYVAEAVARYYALTDDQKRQMSDASKQHWAEKFDAKKNAEQFTEYLMKLLSD